MNPKPESMKDKYDSVLEIPFHSDSMVFLPDPDTDRLLITLIICEETSYAADWIVRKFFVACSRISPCYLVSAYRLWNRESRHSRVFKSEIFDLIATTAVVAVPWVSKIFEEKPESCFYSWWRSGMHIPLKSSMETHTSISGKWTILVWENPSSNTDLCESLIFSIHECNRCIIVWSKDVSLNDFSSLLWGSNNRESCPESRRYDWFTIWRIEHVCRCRHEFTCFFCASGVSGRWTAIWSPSKSALNATHVSGWRWDSPTFDKRRTEGLNTETVKCRSTIQEDVFPSMTSSSASQTSLYFLRWFFCVFDVESVFRSMSLLMTNGRKSTERLVLKATLIHLKRRTDDDNRTTRIVDLFTEEILTEASLLTPWEYRWVIWAYAC